MTQAETGAIFRLLVPMSSDIPGDRPTIEVGGRVWAVSDLGAAPRADAPGYTCVSYASGAGRTPHPFDSQQPMSDRTMAVIDSVVRTQEPEAMWVDAFCVPFDEPARAACLSSMGAIYAHAANAVVVLSGPCHVLLEQIMQSGKVDAAGLAVLERDDWVTRVWTYQEMVNCNKVRFIAEGRSDAWAEAEDLFRCVIYAMSDVKKAHAIDAAKLAGTYPRLDSLEDLFADWKMGPYLERSAYQVMSGMAHRDAAQPEDFFYAMIGALSGSAPDSLTPEPIDPAERFMRICEANGDYSFIFSTARRSREVGRGWRPAVADRLQPVLAWHSWGTRQPGKVHPGHLELDDMQVVQPGMIAPTAKEHVERWLDSADLASSSEDATEQVLRFLRRAGFSGCGEHIETEGGYFFPHLPVARLDDLYVAVATGVRMAPGAPGLALRRTGSAADDWCAAGVFVGPVSETGMQVIVG